MIIQRWGVSVGRDRVVETNHREGADCEGKVESLTE